jgi:hypothetical protein
MNIARIEPSETTTPEGISFIEQVTEIGKAQGFFGLPVRVGVNFELGARTFTSAWEPTPAELEALAAGAKVHVQVVGHQPPILVTVGEPPGEPMPDPVRAAAAAVVDAFNYPPSPPTTIAGKRLLDALQALQAAVTGATTRKD